MLRRIIAWAGLLGVLLHAGLVVHHRAVMTLDSWPVAVSALDDTADVREAGFAQALLASMCRPGNAQLGQEQPSPADPSERSAPCLSCCCPAAQSIVLPDLIRAPHPRLEPQPKRVAWHATHVAIRARTAERPPVRGPPVRA